MAKLIDGKRIAQGILEHVRLEVEKNEKKPGLAVVIVGEDAASRIYVESKKRVSAQLGFYSEEILVSACAGEEKLIEAIQTLNGRDDIHGILVQFPLPAGFDAKRVGAAIAPEKDVDAQNAQTAGRVLTGDYGLLPCTPAAVLRMLADAEIAVQSKHCVIVGASNIVGKPLAMLLVNAEATVTVCHARTIDLAAHTRQADILIAAAGCAGLIEAKMVKPGAVVIDVGINRLEDGRIVGDVCFETVQEVASYITAVPGGVGPVTSAILMENTQKAFCASEAYERYE